MKKNSFNFFLLVFLLLGSCQQDKAPSKTDIAALNLKRGEQILCGKVQDGFGDLSFPIKASAQVNKEFNLGVMMLHSFEYDEAEKIFAKIIDMDPTCLMAYWGVAMSNFHPLWTAPSEAELIKGSRAIAAADQLEGTEKEQAYLQGVASFYNDWKESDHRTRCLRFEQSMQSLHNKYPEDKEATSFYALALTAAADPTDQTFARQKKAGQLLTSLYAGQPNHPGIVHYIIHAYDSPELASLALPAARRYASVAPSSAHALHMPSHIFTRLGLWEEAIRSNRASVDNAKCYAEAAGIKGHWDEELHGLDYLVYAYLQKGDDNLARQQLDYLATMKVVEPLNFKVAHAFAAIPSRYLLENRLWQEAAELKADYAGVNWEKFPWQHSILHATRMMGAIRIGDIPAAKASLKIMEELQSKLLAQKNAYQAKLVDIKIKTGRAWLLLQEGNHKAATALMSAAADLEDRTEKHPVTPGEVIPAREYLADMYLQLRQPGEALKMYEVCLQKNKNRFNALAGAALSASQAGQHVKSQEYYGQLTQIAEGSQRPVMDIAHASISTKGQ